MTVVDEQFLYVLLQGYFKPVLSLRLVLLIYYAKTFGHEPGLMTRSVLNRQASISFFVIGTEWKYYKDNHDCDAHIEIRKHRVTHGVLCMMA